MEQESKNPVITVIGSTGTIGAELVQLLSAEAVAIRGVMRNYDRIQKLPRVAWIQADLSDDQLYPAVLAGTDRLFLLTGNKPGFGDLQIKIIKAAEKAGVKQVVKLSALGATPRTKSPLAKEHWLAEQALERSSMDWTILRPHAFMQNWLGDLAKTIREEDAIYSAVGHGKVPFIDARDIAAVAAQILLHPQKHNRKHYVLTGGEAIGYRDLAEAFSEVLNRSIVYHPLSEEQMRKRMEENGLPSKMIDSLLALASYQKAGGATAKVSEEVDEILGRPPRNIHAFATDYQSFFKRIKGD